MRFSGIFVVSSLIVSAFALPATTFAPTLKSLTDLVKTCTTQVKSFDGALAKFDAIDKAAQALSEATINANEALRPYPPFSIKESSENMMVSEALVSEIEALCASLIEKKSTFVGDKYKIIKVDIDKISGPAFAVMNGLLKLTPKVDAVKATNLEIRAVNAFKSLMIKFK